jgi:hypothetical protein
VRVLVAPPLNSKQVEELETSLGRRLPRVLRDFYITASADAEVSLEWQPNEERAALLEFVGRYTLYSGPRFCSAGSLKYHQECFLDWAEVLEEGPKPGVLNAKQLAELFGLPELVMERRGPNPIAANTLRESVPLIAMVSGDYLAIHLQNGRDDGPVNYISHSAVLGPLSDTPITTLCESGEQFLDVWERFGYVGPDCFELFPFLRDSKTGMLDADSPLARKWRAFLGRFGVPVGE